MTREQIEMFFEKLEGPGYCDFKKDKKGEITWLCKGGNSKSLSIKLFKDMKISDKEIKKFLNLCNSFGGHCDCEILFNSKVLMEEIIQEML